MLTECLRCHKQIDTIQGYKFSPTEYVCMSCYDEFKAERAAKIKKEHKNPLLSQFGEEPAPAAAPPRQAPQEPVQPAPPKAAPVNDAPGMFAPKTPPKPAQQAAAPAAEARKAPPSAEVCDVCQKPIPDFKVPLKGGKKVCMGCNDILRDVAKSLVLNVQCPYCGKEIQLTEE
ncbi:MAG: hypothetical protein HQ583_07445 [Candidatus Abyssubacteria bacterium]|nr:hypothetical protein [Candidatus Abyssubacteria bacterium]